MFAKGAGAMLMTVGLLLLVGAENDARAADSVTIAATGVQTHKEGDAKNPQIPAALAKHKVILKRLGFGKYTSVGKDSKSASVGGKATLTVGSYSIQVNVLKKSAKGVSVSYEITKGGEKVGKANATLSSGKVKQAQVGDPQTPTVILFELE